MNVDALIVGAGLFGSVIASLLAENTQKKSLVIDSRDHIGGNCYDYVNRYGIRMSKYGAHLFHTKRQDLWDFISSYGTWEPWEDKVLAKTKTLQTKRTAKMKGKRIFLAMCLAAILVTFFNITTNHSVFIYFKKGVFEHTSKSRTRSIQEVYGESWNTVITPYVAELLIDGKDICSVSPPPLLLIFVLSLPKNSVKRQAIRQTWGCVEKKNNNAFTVSVKIVFILGVMSNGSKSDKLVREESSRNKDIVQIDFTESRYNLTKKMMHGLRWIQKFCGSVRYILKADDDTFINVARFFNYLLRESNINNKTIHGYMYPKGTNVAREGKYAVTKEELPISTYPPYVSGTAYILPFDVISDMLYLAERLPYCPVDDAFITGVLRVILNVNIQHSGNFTDMMELKFSPCAFHSKIAVTNIDAKCMNMLWNLTTQDPEEIVCKQSALYDKKICPIFE